MIEDQNDDSVTYKEILSCPGYFAGSDGTIWSHRFRKRKRLGEYSTNGRFRVSIVNLYGRKFSAPVHALVCEAFHGPRPLGFVCRHLNGLKDDNRPDNLAWGTHLENAADRERHGSGFRDGIDQWEN